VSRHVLHCDCCGYPLVAPWDALVIVCEACGSQSIPGKPGEPVPAYVPADGRPRLNLGGRSWVIEGRLASGDSSEVYRARWVSRLGEPVVVKIQAVAEDGDLLRAEWALLGALHASTITGAAHFLGRLARPVAFGLVDTDRPRVAAVYGWKSGFVHTLTQVGDQHTTGVPGPVMVWLLKRLLELLGFVHRAGFVHGAVTPDHILVHPRDHGATLVGWTSAVRHDGRAVRLAARPRAWLGLYDGRREATPALDIAMACRCVETVGGWRLPGSKREPAIDRVIARGTSGREDDAWALAEALSAASREAWGPPAYNPLPMPGWAH
jgi:hypothetical protein